MPSDFTAPDFMWFDRVRVAIESGDAADLKTLSMIAASLLDLKREMAPADWERLYQNLSEKMDVQPKRVLALIND